jgi:hypothetical protein
MLFGECNPTLQISCTSFASKKLHPCKLCSKTVYRQPLPPLHPGSSGCCSSAPRLVQSWPLDSIICTCPGFPSLSPRPTPLSTSRATHWCLKPYVKTKTKQLGINHTREGIHRGRKPEGQVEGKHYEGRGRRKGKKHRSMGEEPQHHHNMKPEQSGVRKSGMGASSSPSAGAWAEGCRVLHVHIFSLLHRGSMHAYRHLRSHKSFGTFYTALPPHQLPLSLGSVGSVRCIEKLLIACASYDSCYHAL